jgi:hypothetical protein
MLLFLCSLDLPLKKIKEQLQTIRMHKDGDDIVSKMKAKRLEQERLKKLRDHEKPIHYISDQEMLKKFVNAINTNRSSQIDKVE